MAVADEDKKNLSAEKILDFLHQKSILVLTAAMITISSTIKRHLNSNTKCSRYVP